MNRFVKSLKVAPELFYFWLLQIFATGSLFLSSLHFIHVSKILSLFLTEYQLSGVRAAGPGD